MQKVKMMETKVIDVINLLREYNQNPDNKRLKALYSGRTVFDIIGKGRNETAHSAFLEWLLSGRDITGTSTENALTGLLDILVRRISEQKSDWREDEKIIAISNALLSRTLKITNIKSQTEKVIPKTKSGKNDAVDIWITCDVEGAGNISKFEFYIENKIGSKEGGPKSELDDDYNKLHQTERYHKAFFYAAEDVYQFFVYLSAATNLEDITNDNRPCHSKHFICINYQDIYDDILSQLLESEKLANKEEYLIKEYVKVLSIPMVFAKEDKADKNTSSDSINRSIILATSKEEKELLLKYWRTNQILILIAMQAYEDSDEDEQKVKHDWNRYIDADGKLYTKVEYIQHVFDAYGAAWRDSSFKRGELRYVYLEEFNEQFKKRKSSNYLWLEYSDESLVINTRDDRESAVKQALEKLGVEPSIENEERIIREFKNFVRERKCEETFNRRIKNKIKSCQDFIYDGIVKSNVKHIDEIFEECHSLSENLSINVKKIEYDRDEYREVLANFWDVNKSLIMASIRVLADSSDVSDSTKKSIKEVYEGISKRDWTKYDVSWEGTGHKITTLTALGVFKWFVQTLIWTGKQGGAQFKIANNTLSDIFGEGLWIKKEKCNSASWVEIKKPDWSIGQTTSYYLNIANYKANFDKFLYPYLCNSKDYNIDKHK